MSATGRLEARVLRRETHSPRGAVAIPVAIVAILALAWVGTEAVLAQLGRPALLLSPKTMLADVRALPSVAAGTLGGISAGLAVIGLILLIAALTPGRRARHVLADDRAAIVVDNEVIASSLVRAAADSAGIDPNQAVASVSHRRAVIRITPTSGVAIDKAAVDAAVAARLAQHSLRPALRSSITIESRGKVGA